MEIPNGSFPLVWDDIENRLYAEEKMCKSASRSVGEMAKVLYDGEFAKNADWEKAI